MVGGASGRLDPRQQGSQGMGWVNGWLTSQSVVRSGGFALGSSSVPFELSLGSFLHLVVLYGVYAVGREHRYLEAGIFSASGGPVWRVRSRA
jgi:hypothetical protein